MVVNTCAPPRIHGVVPVLAGMTQHVGMKSWLLDCCPPGGLIKIYVTEVSTVASNIAEKSIRVRVPSLSAAR